MTWIGVLSPVNDFTTTKTRENSCSGSMHSLLRWHWAVMSRLLSECFLFMCIHRLRLFSVSPQWIHWTVCCFWPRTWGGAFAGVAEATVGAWGAGAAEATVGARGDSLTPWRGLSQTADRLSSVCYLYSPAAQRISGYTSSLTCSQIWTILFVFFLFLTTKVTISIAYCIFSNNVISISMFQVCCRIEYTMKWFQSVDSKYGSASFFSHKQNINNPLQTLLASSLSPLYKGQCLGKASFVLTVITEAVRCKAISTHTHTHTS